MYSKRACADGAKNDGKRICLPSTRSYARLHGHHLGPHVSQSALTYSLNYIRENGVPSASSRATQYRARRYAIEEMTTPYGPVVVPVTLPVVERGKSRDVDVVLIHPIAILWRTLHDCVAFAELFRQALACYSNCHHRPWRMVLYMDEVSPSTDVKGGVDGRKMQCVYWTFAEFGVRLYAEDVWMVLASVRSDLVDHKMPGGMSRLVAMCMRQFFSPDTHDASKSGVALKLLTKNGDHTHTRLFIAHHTTIADFKGLCQVLGSNTQSGTKACPECRDIIDPFKSKNAVLESPGLVPFTSTDPDTWRTHDDDSVRRIMAKLSLATGQRYKDLCHYHGYKYCQYNIINDPYLLYRPISTLLYDWQHVWCVSGIFDRSMSALTDELKGVVNCGDFDEYFQP